MITSLQNERVKLAHGLINGTKSRRKLGKVALEGVRLIRDALDAGYLPEFILYDPESDSFRALADTFRSLNLDADALLEASSGVIQHITATEHPQGIVGVFPLP